MRQVESELGEVKQELIKLRALSRPASPKLNRSIRRLDSPVSSLSASVTTSAPSSSQLLNDRTMMLVKDRWAQLVKHPSTSYFICTLIEHFSTILKFLVQLWGVKISQTSAVKAGKSGTLCEEQKLNYYTQIYYSKIIAVSLCPAFYRSQLRVMSTVFNYRSESI